MKKKKKKEERMKEYTAHNDDCYINTVEVGWMDGWKMCQMHINAIVINHPS